MERSMQTTVRAGFSMASIPINVPILGRCIGIRRLKRCLLELLLLSVFFIHSIRFGNLSQIVKFSYIITNVCTA